MTCPICKHLPVEPYTPFCSKHCKNIDLLRWSKGEYRFPVEEALLERESDISED